MKTKLSILIAGLCLLLLASCATHERSAAYAYSSGSRGSGKLLDYNQQKDKEDQRMMIYNASLSVVVKNVDTTISRVADIAKKYNGFVVSSSNYETVIRIPATSLKDALGNIETFGKVTSKNITGKDVTDEYTDYNTRLENAEKARKRYLELLAKAVTVDEILKVEKELERLNVDIDLVKGKMNRIQHLVDYSTITVYHSKKVKPGIIGYVFVGAYKAVKWLFVRN